MKKIVAKKFEDQSSSGGSRNGASNTGGNRSDSKIAASTSLIVKLDVDSHGYLPTLPV